MGYTFTISLSILVVFMALASASDPNCMLPPHPGTNNRSPVLQFYYNSTLRECFTFFYYGGGGNKNRFWSQDRCLNECESTTNLCALEKNEGTGAYSHERYFFNTTTKLCERFQYRGFNGNANKFL
ncbi:mig-6 [Bugula neritina]|uniref:Mig-6 n=1 Tax=Bugula neritina TaxID=10212 RepID=A0A7J7JYT5_BUGNE|nr:mig-6 [Bugula neritina]